MSKFEIRHITKYLYEDPVRDSANQIMLYPIKDEYQEVKRLDISITGDPSVATHVDYFGNVVGTFTNAHPHSELVIDSKLIVVTHKKVLPDEHPSADNQWGELAQIQHEVPYVDFLKQESVEVDKEISKIIAAEKADNPTPLQLARNFNSYVYHNFAYQKGITTVETTVDEIWKIKSGVCQDFAHVLLTLLRSSLIPARYVSGYICPNKTGMRGEGATHAWVEAYIPFYGWLGLDPTNDCLVNETHVRLAVGKNFTDCSPVKGTYRGTSHHTLEVAVSVSYEDGHAVKGVATAIDPDPMPTTSFSRNSFRRNQEMQMQQ